MKKMKQTLNTPVPEQFNNLPALAGKSLST